MEFMYLDSVESNCSSALSLRQFLSAILELYVCGRTDTRDSESVHNNKHAPTA